MKEDKLMQEVKFLKLWDFYKNLLTENQKEVTDLYFNCDLSLAEIAENKGVSKQSVFDTIVKSKKALEDYEEKLGFIKIIDEDSLKISYALTALEKLKKSDKITNNELDKIIEILSKEQ